jgi:integrase
MTKRKRTRKRRLWSVCRIRHPRYRGYMLRVTELAPGGDLYVVRMIDGKQRMALLDPRVTRLGLGTSAKAQERAARAKACEIIEALAEGGEDERAEVGAALTLDTLAKLYEVHGLHGVGATYKRDQVAKLRRINEFLGAERLVVSLCRSDIEAFTAARLLHVSRNTIHGDVGALKIALNWAVEHKRADGRVLLEKSPLLKVRVARETPERPWATVERYEKLNGVADQLPPAFACILDLAWGTGRRISAILALRWGDINFRTSKHCPFGSIKWYAGVQRSKKVHEQVVPMNEIAAAALNRWRELWQGIGNAPVFASPRKLGKPLGKWIPRRWLEQAEELAGLEHEVQGGWHEFRRGWATARKHQPLVDVAIGGGWEQNSAALRNCYLHPDPETTLATVLNVA